MSIEKKFDISFISSLALREKQIQQNYRPIIAVHKWFARRPIRLGWVARNPAQYAALIMYTYYQP